MTTQPIPVQHSHARTSTETGEFTRTGLGREKVGLGLLLILALLNGAAPLSTDMYLSAFPTMAGDLATDAPSIQLTLTTFMLGIGVGQLVIGSLSDRWGRRNPLLVALAVFTVTGALCALAPSIETLVALRFVQGFTGAAGMVIGRAIVADSVRGTAAVQAYSLLSMVGAFAPVVAPLLGALLLPVIGWRGVFWSLVAVGAVLLLVTFAGVRETLPWHRRSGGGLAGTAALARGVLGSRAFVGYTGIVVLAFGALFAYVSASPFVVQNVLGLSPGWYAADFAVNSTALIIFGGLNARLVNRFSPEKLLGVALGALLATSLALLLLAVAGSTSRVLILPLLFVVMAATATVMANGVGLAMSTVTTGQGTASAVIGSAQFGLGALVSPLVGLGGEHTALPMAVAMTVCSGLGLVGLATARGRRQPAESGTSVEAA